MFKIVADSKNRQVQITSAQLGEMRQTSVRKAFYHIGKDLVKESKRLIDLPKSGKFYNLRINRRLKRHRASAPGEAPAKITGNLKASLDFKVQGAKEMEFGSLRSVTRRITRKGNGFTMKGNVTRALGIYPRYLEEGTSKMAPRPFLISSIKNNYRNSINRFKAEFAKQLNKGKAYKSRYSYSGLTS